MAVRTEISLQLLFCDSDEISVEGLYTCSISLLLILHTLCKSTNYFVIYTTCTVYKTSKHKPSEEANFQN